MPTSSRRGECETKSSNMFRSILSKTQIMYENGDDDDDEEEEEEEEEEEKEDHDDVLLLFFLLFVCVSAGIEWFWSLCFCVVTEGWQNPCNFNRWRWADWIPEKTVSLREAKNGRQSDEGQKDGNSLQHLSLCFCFLICWTSLLHLSPHFVFSPSFPFYSLPWAVVSSLLLLPWLRRWLRPKMIVLSLMFLSFWFRF